MSSTIRLSVAALLLILLNLHACRINSLKSGDTFMTKHLWARARQSLGKKYRVLIDTCPEISTEWKVFAGIQTARRGGTTQIPSFVRTVITPVEANSNWSSR